MRHLPTEIDQLLEQLQAADLRQGPSGGQFFPLILQLVEYLASQEDLVRARGIEMEPDRLVSRLLRDPQLAAAAAVNAPLAKLAPTDIRSIERTIHHLECRHGAAAKIPPNHRTIFDGAMLGPVSFIYSRKHREVLASKTLDRRSARTLLPDLLAAVDRLYPAGRPAYLWRLGPEFGLRRNVNHLLDRGDWFIVRSLYRNGVKELAGDVMRWKELPNGDWIGENCAERIFSEPVRNILIRSRHGRREQYSLLWTNLFNTTWEEIARFYQNRSCKHATTQLPHLTPTSRKFAAAAMILAIFTFRNLRTWASVPPAESSRLTIGSSPVGQGLDRVSSLATRESAQVFSQLSSVADYLAQVSGENRVFTRVTASAAPMSYQVVPKSPSSPVTVMTSGQVILVTRDANGDATIVVSHGKGFTSTYRGIAGLSTAVVTGATLQAGQSLGALSPASGGTLSFTAQIAEKFLEKSIEPSVAEMLAPGTGLFLDPLSLLNRYGVALQETNTLESIAPPDGKVRTPKLADAELYQLRSPTLGGRSIFPANPIHPEDMNLEMVADAFDDDVLAEVLDVEIS